MLLSGCNATLPLPSPAHAEAAQKRSPGTSVESLTAARSTYVAKCSGCHTLWLPERLSAAEWPQAVERMQTQHGVELTSLEREQILLYLQSVRSDAER